MGRLLFVENGAGTEKPMKDWHTGFKKSSSTIIQQKPATKRERERKNLQIAEKH